MLSIFRKIRQCKNFLVHKLLFYTSQSNTFDKIFLEKRIGNYDRQNTYYCDCHSYRRRRKVCNTSGHHLRRTCALEQCLDVLIDIIQHVLNCIQMRTAPLRKIIKSVCPVVPIIQCRQKPHRCYDRLTKRNYN